MATLIQVDGVRVDVLGEGENGALTNEQIQGLIGGYYAHTYLDANRLALYDEEGNLKKLPVNMAASEIVGYQVVGPVLLVSIKEMR